MKMLKMISTFFLINIAFIANATFVSIDDCKVNNVLSPASCVITNSPPAVVTPNPADNNLLTVWDEVQNFTLTSNLTVNRVFDPAADFVIDNGNGTFDIKSGTIVSSHYVQWDAVDSGARIEATLKLDSQVFGFIYSDNLLFSTDIFLGLDSINYNDFTYRGLESSDSIAFSGSNTSINWYASNPGDWARLITAFSPAAVQPDSTPPNTVDSPVGYSFILFAFTALLLNRKKRINN
ncbi:hypothetical protein [Paraglaciecola sp.]|uniref:hypothetical protein n=1 Tax=Paraglaciecola sp. TaxID=1920173 RepID=UPI003EF5388C